MSNESERMSDRELVELCDEFWIIGNYRLAQSFAEEIERRGINSKSIRDEFRDDDE